MPGSIRVVSKRWNGVRPEAGEIVIDIDRSNPVMGNRHVMQTQSLAERERVIALHKQDLQQDLATGGPMSREVERLANMLNAGQRIAVRCWCAPHLCHGDNYVDAITRRAAALKSS